MIGQHLRLTYAAGTGKVKSGEGSCVASPRHRRACPGSGKIRNSPATLSQTSIDFPSRHLSRIYTLLLFPYQSQLLIKTLLLTLRDSQETGYSQGGLSKPASPTIRPRIPLHLHPGLDWLNPVAPSFLLQSCLPGKHSRGPRRGRVIMIRTFSAGFLLDPSMHACLYALYR